MLARAAVLAFSLALLLAAWPVPQRASAAPSRPATTYAQLPSAARAAVSRSVGRGDSRFAATALVDGAALFQPKGFSARVAGSTMHIAPEGGPGWSLSLNAWGRAESLADPAFGPVSAEHNEARFAGAGIDAWWVHGPGGLEQGWTIHERPAGAGPLLLALQILSILSIDVHDSGRSATFTDEAGHRHRYSGLWAADATGRELRAWMQSEGAALLIRVDDAGALYPLTIDPWIEVVGLARGAGSADGDQLGYGVAVSADGSTIAAGSPGNFTSVFNRGRVDVFQIFPFTSGFLLALPFAPSQAPLP
jgi:hypothetical protein